MAAIKQVNMKKMSEEEKNDTTKEIAVLDLLHHPNIIGLKESYKTKGEKLCIVMEYADGGDVQT